MTSIFMNMPDLVLSQILNELDFKSIQKLRNVSKTLRGFIDDVRPDSRLLEVTVIMKGPENLEVSYKNDFQEYIVHYQKHGNGCSITHKKIKKMFANEDFSTRAVEDLELILRNQKSILKSLVIKTTYSDGILKTLKTKILESKRSKLKVYELVMETQNQEEILDILPFLDPEPLEEFRVFNSGENFKTLKIDKISKLEHWSKLKEISIESVFISNLDLNNFSEISKVSVDLKSLKAEDVIDLKETLLTSSNFQKFTVFYTEFSDLGELFEILGGPSKDSNFCGYVKSWSFKMPYSTDFLKLDHLDFKQPKFIFSRVCTA